jgi:uncharacterized protein (DUF4415 family)
MSDNGTSKPSRTDWTRIDAMDDDDIDTSDIPPLTAEMFARAEFRRWPTVEVTLRIDADVADWFAAQGKASERHIRQALRRYAETQTSLDSKPAPG